ncbi:MAG: type II toxin-antitoxin system antitoxin SocA domain-containing protein [Candidatus Aminicenantaceae bacterium]
MDIFYNKLGAKIKEIREHLDLSQERIAKLLGINRVAISQIENGERKISAEEIAKLARIFNMPSDILLDLEKDIEVILSAKKKPKLKEKQEIRISVPQKNLDKFKEVVLYILKKVGAKPNVGESVLYKLLYFIDFDFYEKYEEQLIGATYKKNIFGPTPIEFKKIVEVMEREKELVRIEEKYFEYPQRKYLPRREPDLSILKAHELKIIDEVLEKLSDMNASRISEYSHNDVPWLTTDDGDIIDYESVFYRTLPYSMRSYSEEDFQ